MDTAPLPIRQLRKILAQDLPIAFDRLKWSQEEDVYYVEFPAIRPDGTIDRYLTKWTFTYYPAQPPHVTFVNPKTKLYDATGWPKAGSGRLALSPAYGSAPEGLICNSMFYDWYYYGGHGEQPAVSWKPGIHKAIATVTELRDVLQPPCYEGPQ